MGGELSFAEKMQDVHRRLLAPFPPEKIRWRVGQAFWPKSKEAEKGSTCEGRVLAYIDVRDRDERLDNAVGPFFWNERIEIVTGGFLATLTLLVDGVAVTRCDGAPATDVEGFKGGISDAKKRVGVSFGIARYLYDLGETRASLYCEYVGRTGPVWNIPDSEMKKLRSLLPSPESQTPQAETTNVFDFLAAKRDHIFSKLKATKSKDDLAKILGNIADELGSKWVDLDDVGKMRYILLMEARLDK